MSLLLLFGPRQTGGATFASGALTADGAGVAQATGASLATGDVSSAGSGTLTANAASLNAASFLAAGVGGVSKEGASLNAGALYIVGASEAAFASDVSSASATTTYEGVRKKATRTRRQIEDEELAVILTAIMPYITKRARLRSVSVR